MATWVNLMDIIYPVGSVYSSYTSASPASRFGGSWTAITGTFPYYNAGTGTGGSNSHTLTVAEMPAHAHGVNQRTASSGPGAGDAKGVMTAGGEAVPDWYWCDATWATPMTAAEGGGRPHNNMPAYQTLYAWRRTA